MMEGEFVGGFEINYPSTSLPVSLSHRRWPVVSSRSKAWRLSSRDDLDGFTGLGWYGASLLVVEQVA